MGYLELQVLAGDASARGAIDGFGTICEDVRVGSGNIVYVRPTVAASLDDVAALNPLMISIDHLRAVPYDAAIGQEHFDVGFRKDAEGSDVIELRAGDMDFTVLVAGGGPWPHVMLHRARPRRNSFAISFTALLERAFFAALRDAVGSLKAQVSQARSQDSE